MKKRITISKEYPSYWEYDGKPVMLLGGTVEDNLFQIANLEEHLRLLHEAGGNYVRCTMSARDAGNVWPHEKGEDGLYDLNKPSQEYWDRFERFLALSYQMDIIVQIEVWDRFDFVRDPWQSNSFNPKNNSSYSVQESRLVEDIQTHPQLNESRFFFTIPEEDNNELVLGYQQAFVDRMLEASLPYPHVLYCMDNETNAVEGWGRYWARYIQRKAAERGLEVHTTEMWDAWDLSNDQHKSTFDHPELYSFCDVSQNNHNCGDEHWEGLGWVRQRIRKQVRPLNNVKIYGADTGQFGKQQDGLERFWRNVFGKMASARFHRPPSGLGLSDIAQAHLKSMRMLLQSINLFTCEPHNDLLLERQKNGAYCMAHPQREAAVFFTGEGEAVLNTSRMGQRLTVEWLDVEGNRWLKPMELDNVSALKLRTPGKGLQAVIVHD